MPSAGTIRKMSRSNGTSRPASKPSVNARGNVWSRPHYPPAPLKNLIFPMRSAAMPRCTSSRCASITMARKYIQLPEAVKTGEAPVLFLLGPDNRPQIANYRVKTPTLYEVDKLFERAVLVVGTGG